MTPQEQLKAFNDIAESLLTCRRENIRTLARLKALETIVME
jgi:CRP-like cAMP-binding protein